MDSILYVLMTWKNEAIAIIALLFGILLICKYGNVWSQRVSYTFILGIGLLPAALPLYYRWNIGVSSRALFCMLLYVWCVLGMLLMAARHVNFIKISVALMLQGGIVYFLFRLI